jgi:valine dehydrogenase (NAD+)
MDGEFEQVVYNHDPASGLKAIIAIHSTALGPALGGTRFYPYATEEEALTDVLRLARGMSYKAAAAGLDLGGGKAVIIGDPKRIKSEALLRAYGRFVGSLGGRYITAEDIGTFPADMDMIARETSFVTGQSQSHGGAGDPSIMTAYGVFIGMQAIAEELWKDHGLTGRHVQGRLRPLPPAAPGRRPPHRSRRRRRPRSQGGQGVRRRDRRARQGPRRRVRHPRPVRARRRGQ